MLLAELQIATDPKLKICSQHGISMVNSSDAMRVKPISIEIRISLVLKITYRGPILTCLDIHTALDSRSVPYGLVTRTRRQALRLGVLHVLVGLGVFLSIFTTVTSTVCNKLASTNID